MTDAEILDLIARILRGEGSDEEFGEWIEQLNRSTRCPHVLQFLREADATTTPEQILERARQYKPIQM
jgi:hypothetical protein